MEAYKSGSHTVWDCKYHLVWTTKYRYQVLGGDVGYRCRELLREITGEYIPELSAPKDDFPLVSPNPADEGSWIDLAMDQNLALVSSRFDEEIARDDIAFRRTGHYPTVELVANYRDTDGEFEINRIAGQPAGLSPFPSDATDDSISIQLNIPLFEGGATSSRVR